MAWKLLDQVLRAHDRAPRVYGPHLRGHVHHLTVRAYHLLAHQLL